MHCAFFFYFMLLAKHTSSSQTMCSVPQTMCSVMLAGVRVCVYMWRDYTLTPNNRFCTNLGRSYMRWRHIKTQIYKGDASQTPRRHQAPLYQSHICVRAIEFAHDTLFGWYSSLMVLICKSPLNGLVVCGFTEIYCFLKIGKQKSDILFALIVVMIGSVR